MERDPKTDGLLRKRCDLCAFTVSPLTGHLNIGIRWFIGGFKGVPSFSDKSHTGKTKPYNFDGDCLKHKNHAFIWFFHQKKSSLAISLTQKESDIQGGCCFFLYLSCRKIQGETFQMSPRWVFCFFIANLKSSTLRFPNHHDPWSGKLGAFLGPHHGLQPPATKVEQ